MSTFVEQAVRAVQYDNLDLVRDLILSKRISVSVTDGDGCSLLHWAAINNRISIMIFLMSQGCTLNHCGGVLMETPLHWAIRLRRYAAVNLLTENGADLTIRSGQGIDALLLACQLELVNMVFLLLCRGASPNSTDNDGNTPLLWLIKNNRGANDLLRLLVRFGTDIFQQDSDGNTALHFCSLTDDILLLTLVFGSGNGNDNSYAIRNKAGFTPYQVALKHRSAHIIRFYYDLWFSRYLPHWAPTVASALFMSSLCVFLHLPGWYGLLSWAMVAFVLEKFHLPMLLRYEDRTKTGTVWGVIVGTLIVYHLHLRWVVSPNSALIFAVGMVLSSVSLMLCAVRKPLALRRGVDKNTVVTAMLEWETQEGSVLGTEFDGSSDIIDAQKPVFQLCPTCLVNRSVSYHCSKCNICVPLGDHHCPFTQSCVGQGTRRMFLSFVLCASITSASFLAQSIWVGSTVICPDEHGVLYGVWATQACVSGKVPALALMTWLSLVVFLWTTSAVIQQIVYVFFETTTYEVISRGHDHSDARSASQSCYTFTYEGLCRLCNFLLTGRYTVSSRVRKNRVGVERASSSAESVVTKEVEMDIPQSNLFSFNPSEATRHTHMQGHGHEKRCCEAAPQRLDPGALRPAVWSINAAERV